MILKQRIKDGGGRVKRWFVFGWLAGWPINFTLRSRCSTVSLDSDPDPSPSPRSSKSPRRPCRYAMPLATSVAKRNRGSAHSRSFCCSTSSRLPPEHQPRIRAVRSPPQQAPLNSTMLGCRSCDVIRISCRNATTAASDTGFFMVFTAQGAPCNDPLKTLSGERKRTSR